LAKAAKMGAENNTLATVDVDDSKNLYHEHAKEISGLEAAESSDASVDGVFENTANDNRDMSRMGKDQVLRVSVAIALRKPTRAVLMGTVAKLSKDLDSLLHLRADGDLGVLAHVSNL
jgi:hypothetical protein